MEKIGLAAVLDMSDFDANMAKYDSSLDKMNKTTADAAGKVGQQFVGLGDAVNKAALVVATAFVAATAAAGAALAKFTGDGISKAMDLEAQMGAIAAVMGVTKKEVEPLGDLIQNLALDPKLKVNTTEAADAIEMLGRNGLTMSEIMDGAARSTVLLANATEADFGMAADIATASMKVFNIEAEDMDKAVDGITSVVNNSMFTIDDYALAIAQSGGVAGAVGVEFDDFNAVIAGTSPAFASGSDAGTSFKTFLQRLVPDTKEATDTMRDLGLFTGLSKDEFEKAENKIAKYEEQLAKLDPTSKNAAEKQSELESKIRVLKGSLDEGQNAFFHVDGSMRDMNEIAGLLQGALSGLSEEQKITALGAIFQADAQRTANELAKLGEKGFTDLKAVMGNTSAEEAAATRMDNLAGAIEILQGVIEAVQTGIGQKFLPVLQDLAEQLTALVDQNREKIFTFFGGVAEWVAVKVPLAMEWLVNTGLPAMGDAFNYLTDTVFPGIAGAIAWATENWDFLSAAIKVVAGVLVTASLASTFTTIAAAVGPLISLIAGAGGLVTSIVGAGGLVAALGAVLNPVGLVVAAVAGLALAWGLASRDTDASLVAMRENAEREANQMAVVTGETFGGWVDSVVAYHRQMKDESGLTLDQMIDNINADFWQMRQDVEAESGAMSQSAIDEMNRMRLEAIKQASEMNTGVTAEVSDMAAVSAVTSEAFTAQIVSDANKTKDGAVGSMAAMNTAISAELDNLQVSSHISSSEMKAGILRELDSLRIQHEDGTITWTEGALEKIAWMSAEAQREQLDMRNGVVTESRLLSTEAVAATAAMGDDVAATYAEMAAAVRGELSGMQQASAQHLATTKSSWDTTWDNISARVSSAAGTISGAVSSLGGNVQGALNTAMNSALSNWGAAWENVRATISNKAHDIATAARSAGYGAVDTLRSGWESGTGMFARAVQSVAGSISGYFEERNNHWLTAGRNVIEGVSTGISNRAGGLYAQMQSVANSVLGTFKSALGIRSPSEVFAEAGYNIAAGLAQGITEGQGLVSEAMARLQNQTQLELNQYSAMVDNQLAATIRRYQQGLAQGQAQDTIRQGFSQEQYAAYWAAIQAGESEASAIAKGQAVTPAAGGGGTAGGSGGSAGGGGGAESGSAWEREQARQAAYYAAHPLEDWRNLSPVTALQSLGLNMDGALTTWNGFSTTGWSNEEATAKLVEVADLVNKVLGGDFSKLTDALTKIREFAPENRFGNDVQIRLGALQQQMMAGFAEFQAREEEARQATIATSSLGALLGRFGGQRQLSADEIAARKAVAAADIQPNMMALDATIENLQSQMQELNNAYDMERNRLLGQGLSSEAVTAALNQWLQANGNQQRGIAAFSQLRDAQTQRGQLDSLLAERMAQIDAESVTMATPEVSSITRILQNFAASTLGTNISDFMADLEHRFSNIYGSTSQILGNARYFGIDTEGLEQSSVIEAAKTLFSAGGETIFSTIDNALSTLLNYRGIAAEAAVENTGGVTDGGWGAPQLTAAISDIASALRQMQAGTTFNVAFQGSAGANADVLSDIQFLNSLYATP